MAWLNTLLIVVQLFCAVSITILILLQHGKGADMGAAFGSGASGSLFGASGSANFLSRTTAILATVFFITTIAMAYTATNARIAGTRPDQGGVMSAPAGGPATGDKGSTAPGTPAPTGGPADIPSGATPQAPAPTQGAPAAPAAPANRPADIPK